MSKRKAYALRIDENILKAMQKWADDELRSLNAQIEYVLRDSLKRASRIKDKPSTPIEVDQQQDKSESN